MIDPSPSHIRQQWRQLASMNLTLTIKTLGGDLLSVDCLLNDSLLGLKRKIYLTAASQLGVYWPEERLRLMSLSNLVDEVDASDSSINDHCGDLDETSWTDDSMSLQGLRLRDGDVLAVLIEDRVRFPSDQDFFFLKGGDFSTVSARH